MPLKKRNQYDICTAQDGKVGCNTVEYTTVFLYSDWLYFLRQGINILYKVLVSNRKRLAGFSNSDK